MATIQDNVNPGDVISSDLINRIIAMLNAHEALIINSGPVRIVSDVPIVAAERVIYTVNGVRTSFSEMMALRKSTRHNSSHLP